MKRAGLFLSLALVVGGCAPKNYVVLLENPEGGTGQVIVQTEKGKQTLDEAGTASAIDRSSRAPSSPWKVGVEKIQEVFSRAFGARPERFEKFVIFFAHGKTDVDAGSEATYRAMLAEVRQRPGVDATVAGHADRTAEDGRNEAIALVRAYKVRDALVAAGIPIERIELDSYGESRPAVPTDDDVPELRNRRVEVTLR